MAGRRAQWGALLLFAAAAWLVYDQLLAYRIALQYQTPAAFFLFTRSFLLQWLDHPGGLLLYVGRFLRQFFHFIWAGALVVGLMSTVLGAVLVFLARRAGNRSLLLPLLPCVYLLIIHAASTTVLGVLMAAAFLAACMALRGAAIRHLVACLILPLLYWSIGAFAWLFVLSLCLSEAHSESVGWRHRLAFPLILVLEALLLPPIAYRWLLPISWHTAWLAPMRWPPVPLDWVLFAYLAVLPVWGTLPVVPLSRWLGAPRRSAALQAGILLCATAVLLAQAYSPGLRIVARYDRLYHAQRWEAILTLANSGAGATTTAGVEGAMVQFFVDHALCRTGRLLDSMFQYPQPWGTRGLVLDLPSYADDVRLAEYTSDLFYTLEHINAAYRCAYDQCVVQGRTYANVLRLAQCSLVNGDDALAAKYVTVLEHTLFHRDQAQRLRRLLTDPQRAARELSAQRRLLPTVELDVGLGNLGALLALARGRVPNRMAMEYLIAWCLLDKQALPLAVDEMLALRRVGYTQLPVHCQEALLLWCWARGTSLKRARKLCAPGVLRSFDRFLRQPDAAAPSATEGSPAGGGAGTYMGYYAYSMVPASYVPAHGFQRLADEFLARADTVAFRDLLVQARLHRRSRARNRGHPQRSAATGSLP